MKSRLQQFLRQDAKQRRQRDAAGKALDRSLGSASQVEGAGPAGAKRDADAATEVKAEQGALFAIQSDLPREERRAASPKTPSQPRPREEPASPASPAPVIEIAEVQPSPLPVVRREEVASTQYYPAPMYAGYQPVAGGPFAIMPFGAPPMVLPGAPHGAGFAAQETPALRQRRRRGEELRRGPSGDESDGENASRASRHSYRSHRSQLHNSHNSHRSEHGPKPSYLEEEDEDDHEGQLQIILEPSTENEVQSIVEMGAISCLSGRLPGVSIFFAVLVLLVVGAASSVLMAAAQSSYDGVPCEGQAECLAGSFCTEDDDLAVCRPCVTFKYEVSYNPIDLFKELIRSDRARELVFVNNEVQNAGYTYNCPKVLSDLSICEERCEAAEPECIASQYLAFFAADEPATIIVAVFTILFFALLSREQQQQTLSAFFYMRHEVQYNALRELGKRLRYEKKKKRRIKNATRDLYSRMEILRERGDAPPAEGVELGRQSPEMEEKIDEFNEDDAIEEILLDENDPVPGIDDLPDDSTEGTLEGQVNDWYFLARIYSESVVSVMLQMAALPLMRVSLFIELVSLRTAVLVSSILIMFSNATILDFLVNGLAVLFVLELDETLFTAMNQSFPGIVTTYIAKHKAAEENDKYKALLRKRFRDARKEGLHPSELGPPPSKKEMLRMVRYEAEAPRILLTAFETNLIRFACMLHTVSVLVYAIYTIALPKERCFTSGEDFMRFVWFTSIFLLFGELLIVVMIHYVMNWIESGKSLNWLPASFCITLLIMCVEFWAVFLFQLFVQELLQSKV